MPISEETFERVALEDPDGKWELHCGRLTYLIASVREPDGSYTEHVFHGGLIRPRALPNVAIDLDELFDL
jgi:hypothetical protein